jgi:hypothetical protein
MRAFALRPAMRTASADEMSPRPEAPGSSTITPVTSTPAAGMAAGTRSTGSGVLEVPTVPANAATAVASARSRVIITSGIVSGVGPPEDPPFYPATWLVAFGILVYGWIEWGPWPATGVFLGLLVVQAALVEAWLALRARSRE